MSFSHYGNAYWRPYELEAAKKYLGCEVHHTTSDFHVSRQNTESLGPHIDELKRVESETTGNIINPVKYYNITNNKEDCLKIWDNNNLRVPYTRVINDEYELDGVESFPLIARLNNYATGEHSYYVENLNELHEVYRELWYAKVDKNSNIIISEFIDTKINGFYVSYRVIVAGGEIICYYARLSNNWIAISACFKEEMKDQWIAENIKKKNLINKNEDNIIKAVEVSGLHHVGLDIIPSNNDLYFLELQPFYFSGRNNGIKDTGKPYYNPYKPKEFVDFLIENEKELKNYIPDYYENWLSKENHFDLCYKSLVNYFED